MANILVVDDELGIRDLLSEILNDEGHSVDLAENATQARAARLANQYDLVLLDICLLYTSPSPRDQRGSRMPSSA